MDEQPKKAKLVLGGKRASSAGSIKAKSSKSKPQPKQILTLEEATRQLADLDTAVMTEEDRIAAIVEIRARLDEHDSRTEDPAETMERRLLLLKTWNELIKIRVINVQKDRPPPFEKPKVERLFTPAEIEPEPQAEAPAPVPVAETAPPPRLKPLVPKPIAKEEIPVAAEPEVVDDLVSVKLLASETVRGIRLEAGMVVSVQPEDAKNLIEKGKAIRA